MAKSDLDEWSVGFTGGRAMGTERSKRCGVGAAGAADPQRVASGATSQDRHAGGDKLHSIFTAHRVPPGVFAAHSFPPRSRVYNIFRKFQHDGVWEANGAELHTAVREWMGREASPSVAVLDSQSVKSSEKWAEKTTGRVATPVSR
jgi:transposase